MIKEFGKVKYELEENLAQICKAGNPRMSEDLERVLLAGGKRLRPALAYAAYRLKEDSDLPIMPLMLMIELMHSASLIHDDVVDTGLVRRGVATINATSGNECAVWAADYLLARAMEYLKIYKGTGINERLAKVSEEMCLGEFAQIDNLNKELTEDIYFDLIKKKTAYFISASAACGAVAAGLDEDGIKMLEEYGLNIGIAFQIKDDILDFTSSSETGKTGNQDEKKGLMTLPQMTGISKAQKQVELYSRKSIEAIKKIKDCKAKTALEEMAANLAKRKL